jgi:hypothetical protein
MGTMEEKGRVVPDGPTRTDLTVGVIVSLDLSIYFGELHWCVFSRVIASSTRSLDEIFGTNQYYGYS